jgi:Zn-dependent M28 family amino/carboxypeptidase
VQAVLYTLSIFFAWQWVWYVTIPTAVCSALLAAICIEADLTPFTAGANDNATAVGMVLALAEHFKQAPLQHTRVFAVCTSCEEVQHYGMIDFYKRHRAELKDPKAVIFEMLGCAGPAWLMKEGIVVPFKADEGLVNILETLARENPEWGAYPAKISGGNTEMADAVRYKVPAITIFGMTKDGVAPYWHQTADTFDKMDAEVMERTWLLTTALISKVDS